VVGFELLMFITRPSIAARITATTTNDSSMVVAAVRVMRQATWPSTGAAILPDRSV
jgi:hypothetical protein